MPFAEPAVVASAELGCVPTPEPVPPLSERAGIPLPPVLAVPIIPTEASPSVPILAVWATPVGLLPAHPARAIVQPSKMGNAIACMRVIERSFRVSRWLAWKKNPPPLAGEGWGMGRPSWPGSAKSHGC